MTVLFSLSGCLVTTLLLGEEQRPGSSAVQRFYARRTLRILPLFHVVLALPAAATAVGAREAALQPGPLLSMTSHTGRTARCSATGQERQRSTS